MIARVAAQLLVLYDEAIEADYPEAAKAFALAFNLVRNETRGVKVSFGGPPPVLRQVPRMDFPDALAERLPPHLRPSS